ncbi:TonB-dependent receptor plug domain-containing protein, partial [Acinetobacter baumannii]
MPGLSIQAPEDRSSCGSQIRGRTASFQINGVPVNEDLRPGSCTSPFALSPCAVESVEVVRGGTALYGAGAPGGIINLQTRRAK